MGPNGGLRGLGVIWASSMTDWFGSCSGEVDPSGTIRSRDLPSYSIEKWASTVEVSFGVRRASCG